MTNLNLEFENQFDILYNSIASNQAPGLDSYEKSVFLTKAQDEILLAYFDPKGNKVQEGFDGSQRRQIDFSKVTCLESYGASQFSTAIFDYNSNSRTVSMPNNILVMLNERVLVTRQNKDEYLTVIPVPFQEYDRLMSKPFKRPRKYQAWRIFNYDGSNKSDLIVGPSDTIREYTFRYVKKPSPIILSDLEDGLTINGISTETPCELDPILYHEVIQRGVELAKASYMGDLNSQIALGNASQTPIGVIPQAR